MDKAKHEYHDLQKTLQQISTKNHHEKSKLEKYLKKVTKILKFLFSILVNIVKKVMPLNLVLNLFNKKPNNIKT